MKIKLLLLFIISTSVFANTLVTEINYPKKGREQSLKYKKTFGHNMSGNTYTLGAAECVASPYLSACGITDNLLIGTSTWMYWDYNTNSIALRYARNLNAQYRLGIQSVYMKSFDTETEYYQMENIRTQIILSNKVGKFVTHHYNLNYEYFMDETVPHSFRREPLNDDPYQVSLSNLFEVDLSDQYIIQYELGVHGLNYTYPQLLTGFSVGRRWTNAYFQFGFSANGTVKGYSNMRRTDSNTYSERNQDLMRTDFALHPELQYQYYF